jgi:hypothetical protein
MRAASIVVGIVVIAAILYSAYYYRIELGLVRPANPQTLERAGSELPASSGQTPGWQLIDRPADGFRIEMPSGTAGVTETRIPAFAGDGIVEPVETIEASPGPETTFAVSWADNPPVERASSEDAQRTFDLARDGALARTRTTLTGESRSSSGGLAVRDFAARNNDGGVLSARLILAGTRLYMLTAALPASGPRHDEDVSRFFNSFSIVLAPPAE